MGLSRKHGRKPKKIGEKKKIAFVCSGGASKAGAFHLGVALALQEYGFKFVGGLKDDVDRDSFGPMEISTYVGSSAGSIITSYLAAGYSLENIFNSFLSREPKNEAEKTPRVLERLTYSRMFKLRPGLAKEQLQQFLMLKQVLKHIINREWESLVEGKWLKTTGLFSTEGIEEYLREEVFLSDRFEDYVVDLFIVATQLNHSKKVVFGKLNDVTSSLVRGCQYRNDVLISQACAASTALPFIYAPYPISNKNGRQNYFVDGEIRDTLSTHVAIDSGADLIIASYTHQPYHYVKEVGSLTKLGLPAILIQSIYLVIEQKINKHIHNKELQRNAIDAVAAYCKQQGLPEDQRRRICEIMETELRHRRDVDTIYIHPRPRDHRMFVQEHFTLSTRKMTEVVKSGFRAAIEILNQYEFEDRNEDITQKIITTSA